MKEFLGILCAIIIIFGIGELFDILNDGWEEYKKKW